MRSSIATLILSALLVSCGAAKNSGREGNSANSEDSDRINRDTGLTQLDADFQKSAFSQVYRNKENIRLTYSEIMDAVLNNKVPLTTRMIPDIEVHIDSEVSSPAKIPSEITECGNSVAEAYTLSDRIKDCKDKVPEANAIAWAGKKNGINGEGDWQLVSYSNNKQVWQDLRTGLLWSDIVATADYEVASGVEMGSTDNFKDRVCQTITDTPKDALGKIHSSRVEWRLPNRNEYLQADINGARFVLPNTDQLTWTSSYSGDDNAWAINQKTGVLQLTSIGDSLSVRCVGIAK